MEALFVSLSCAEAQNFSCFLNVPLKAVHGFSYASLEKTQTSNPIMSETYSLRPPITINRSQGILTLCPSGAVFTIPLGPTNPWLIDITKETLIFRRDAFSASLRLLVPTFLLPHAPVALASLPSQQSGTLSYHANFTNEIRILIFGIILSPNYFRRKISR